MSTPELALELESRIREIESGLLDAIVAKRKGQEHESRISWLNRWFTRVYSLCSGSSTVETIPKNSFHTAAQYFAAQAASQSSNHSSSSSCCSTADAPSNMNPSDPGCSVASAGACAPNCIPERKIAFDPLFDSDNNPWLDPIPDESHEARRFWQTGLYWSFLFYSLLSLALLIAHAVIFGLSSSIQAAVSGRTSSTNSPSSPSSSTSSTMPSSTSTDPMENNPCWSVYFISIGNIAGLALAPGILVLVRLLLFVRDQLMGPCNAYLRMISRCWFRCYERPMNNLSRRWAAFSCFEWIFGGCCPSCFERPQLSAPLQSQRTLVSHPTMTLSLNINLNTNALPSSNGNSVESNSSLRVPDTSSTVVNGDDETARRDSSSSLESGDDDNDDDENESIREKETTCDQAVLWSGNLLLVLAVLDIIFFTVWNFISPFVLSSTSSVKCSDISPEFTSVQWITSILLYVFFGELLTLWIISQLYGFCSQRYGLCLSQNQIDAMEALRISEKLDRDLQAEAQRNHGVRRILLLGPPGSGKRHFLNLFSRAIHAGRLPGLHLLQFAGLKQKGGTNVTQGLSISLPQSLVDCFKIPSNLLSLGGLFSSTTDSHAPSTSISSAASSSSSNTSIAIQVAHQDSSADCLPSLTVSPELTINPLASDSLSITSASSSSSPPFHISALRTGPADWIGWSGLGSDVAFLVMELAGPESLATCLSVCRAWFVRFRPLTDRLFASWMQSMLTLDLLSEGDLSLLNSSAASLLSGEQVSPSSPLSPEQVSSAFGSLSPFDHDHQRSDSAKISPDFNPRSPSLNFIRSTGPPSPTALGLESATTNFPFPSLNASRSAASSAASSSQISQYQHSQSYRAGLKSHSSSASSASSSSTITSGNNHQIASQSKRFATRQALCAWDRFFFGPRSQTNACRTLRLYDTTLRGEIQIVFADFPQHWPSFQPSSVPSQSLSISSQKLNYIAIQRNDNSFLARMKSSSVSSTPLTIPTQSHPSPTSSNDIIISISDDDSTTSSISSTVISAPMSFLSSQSVDSISTSVSSVSPSLLKEEIQMILIADSLLEPPMKSENSSNSERKEDETPRNEPSHHDDDYIDDEDDENDHTIGYRGLSIDEAIARAARAQAKASEAALASSSTSSSAPHALIRTSSKQKTEQPLLGRRNQIEAPPPKFRPSQRFHQMLLDSLHGRDSDIVGVLFLADLVAPSSMTSKQMSSSSSASLSATYEHDITCLQNAIMSLGELQEIGAQGRATPRLVCFNNRQRFELHSRQAAFASSSLSLSSSSSISSSIFSNLQNATSSTESSTLQSSDRFDTNMILDSHQRRLAVKYSSLLFAVNDRARPDTDDVLNMFMFTWQLIFPNQIQRWQSTGNI